MQLKERYIYVTFQFEGIHCYPGVEIDGVGFLTHPHRHVFHVRVELEVFHDDREIEFIDFKRSLKDEFKDGEYDNKSCEMIAQDIIQFVEDNIGHERKINVEVAEDGENGAIVKGVINV